MTSNRSAAPTGRNTKRLANGLLALSSAAVMAVYGAGYLHTAPAAATVDSIILPTATSGAVIAQAPTNTVAPATATSTSTATAVAARPTAAAAASTAPPTTAAATATRAATATATSTKTSTATATVANTTASAVLKDGSYAGTGSSRHGSITATVVIQGGKIVSANITDCGTRYPCSKIAALPGQVLARQSASVDYVSGATDSSVAYRSAVAAALALAR